MKDKKTKKILIIAAIVLVTAVAAFLVLLFTGVLGSGETKVKGPEVVFTPEAHFISPEEKVTAVCTKPATEEYTIFYTLNGSDPVKKGKRLKEEGVELPVRDKETVSCYTVSAVAKFADGTYSDVFCYSYFVGEKVTERFDIPIFSLTILPEDFDGENGIYTNYEKTGAEWEKPVFVEYFEADGKRVIAQDGGIRVHGGASRKKPMKSYRLYARSEYDADQKSFEYPFFDGAKDANGKPITKYKRLILRDSGNDNNNCFVRDALIQTLSKEAGFLDTEEVAPCALFINGKYQGFYWTQEYYGEKYFKATYGKYEGEFDKSEHKENANLEVREENLEFLDLAKLDLTDDANYKKVTDQIDVENYLFYYAINTIVDNEDWPQTNSYSYRYIPGPGEAAKGTGVFDGRWRFMIHDDDMTYGLGKNHPTRETLKMIMDPTAVKHHSKTLDLLPYSPLFTALMEREDCRLTYVNKVRELTEGVFNAKHVNEVLDKFVKMQANELKYYFKECEYAGGKKMADYKASLQTLRDYINSSEKSIKDQIYDVWSIDIR